MSDLTTDIAKRAMNLLSDQINDLEAANRVLARAIEDIEEIADENVDLDSHSWNAVSHICKTGGVRTAMSVIASQE